MNRQFPPLKNFRSIKSCCPYPEEVIAPGPVPTITLKLNTGNESKGQDIKTNPLNGNCGKRFDHSAIYTVKWIC